MVAQPVETSNVQQVVALASVLEDAAPTPIAHNVLTVKQAVKTTNVQLVVAPANVLAHVTLTPIVPIVQITEQPAKTPASDVFVLLQTSVLLHVRQISTVQIVRVVAQLVETSNVQQAEPRVAQLFVPVTMTVHSVQMVGLPARMDNVLRPTCVHVPAKATPIVHSVQMAAPPAKTLGLSLYVVRVGQAPVLLHVVQTSIVRSVRMAAQAVRTTSVQRAVAPANAPQHVAATRTVYSVQANPSVKPNPTVRLSVHPSNPLEC